MNIEEAKLYLEHTSKDDFNLEEWQKENRYQAIQVVLKEIERLRSIIKEAREYIQDRYDGKLYNFDKEQDDYMCFIICHYDGLLDNLFTFKQLDNYVEILDVIEENKKIEKIDMFDYFTGYDFDGTSKDLLKHLERNFEKTNEKLNEIIDYINKEKE